jgi:hypothetical protein
MFVVLKSRLDAMGETLKEHITRLNCLSVLTCILVGECEHLIMTKMFGLYIY